MSRPPDDDSKPLWIVDAERAAHRASHGPPLWGVFDWSSLRLYLASGLLAVLVALLFNGFPLWAHVHLNVWWFDSLHLGTVYARMWSVQRALFLVTSIPVYVAFTAVFIAARALTFRPGIDAGARAIGVAATATTGFLAAVMAIVVGHGVAAEWQQYLLATNGGSFGVIDPIHHRDIGFYVFTMPWRETVAGYLVAIFILIACEAGALVGIFTATSPFHRSGDDVRRTVSLVSLFAGLLFLFLAWRNIYLNPYNLDQPGTAFGAGATFAHASLWWFPIVATVQAIAALVLLANVYVRRTTLTAVVALPIAISLAAAAGQGIFQRFVVSPNELSAEFKYLGYALHSTRQAFGIDGWKVREYTPRPLQSGDVARDTATISDIRIADTGATTQVLRQRQENRTYYAFNTADIDRYTVAGQQRQVLLAARELDYSKLSAQAQTWVNQHVKFTHGYGLTMSPANTVTPDGQPVLWIQNVPVQETVKGLPAVHQPRIYFGEFTRSWIVANATTPEFDSTNADRDTSYRYTGPDGVTVGSGVRRLTLAWTEEGGFPFVNRLNISQYIRSQSKILLRRNIFDRVSTIAPWLSLDRDPYLVLRSNGSLVWMMDGTTQTDHYPYSEPVGGANYRRNSVKVVVDAYTGKVTFYAFGPRDPILSAWSHAFPGLIHPESQIPADIRAHIKYPADYLSWQAHGYDRYHVTSVTSYYNGDNEWDIESSNQYNWGQDAQYQQELEPIWTVARLFGETHDSFFSILPFSVHGKATMAGYIAADNGTYKVTALDMPRGAQTMGVTQFESLYNQAPAISSQLTLIDQRGSQVIPGQIVILPVGKALLYIKPLYLRSASAQSLPQLIRVVVGTQNSVNWGFSLQDALQRLLTQGDISSVSAVPPSSNPSTSPTPQVSPTPLPANGRLDRLSDKQLIQLANQYYTAAQSSPSLTEKDKDLRHVGEILNVLASRHH